jgi:hypothetical protein
MRCENCGQPVVAHTRKFRGSTGWIHESGRLWCAGRPFKAEPIVCAMRGCTEPATVHPTQLGTCDRHPGVNP